MNLEIDVLTGRVLVDGKVVWTAGEPAPVLQSGQPVRYLDLTGRLVIGEAEGKGVVAAVLFDEEEFPDSILTSRMVKRFAKRTGVLPEMQNRPVAVARFPWGLMEFAVDPKQGDLTMTVQG
ncbi:hypothetical protein SAMN05216359_101348 [Roseateles sp. YR242]|uniref:hypothetical protein n=1 Tax=Roseateles sp. YR242 TaxID=1855305 RepID=UPI0008B62351|nr:hypothetical protein [Roseateles sp. YR242]SEK30119.1 hypothetical protein SAMN05216359_101348 [Roseateles sp. YR242]